jgi:Na+/H+ antiporter NhaC
MPSTTIVRLSALCPLIVFFCLFLGSGLYFSLTGQVDAFYQVSASVAILPAIIFSILLCQEPFNKRIEIFLEGVRDNNIIIMVLIYLLAGAFATVLQNTGGVYSVVNFCLSFISAKATLPALFLVAAAVSTAIGTSMGTIAAIGPIGVGIAQSIGLPLPLTMGVIVGGAMFGDNLSLISDTSIAATQIHGCSPRAKFKSNLKITFPTMLVTLLIVSLLGSDVSGTSALTIGDYQLLPCLPYLIVLVLALLGINVFVVLTIGIILASIVGLFTLPTYTLLSIAQDIFTGYKSMAEILIFSLLMGGLGALIKHQGGFLWITNILERAMLKKKIVHQKSAECAMGLLVGLTDICTANNTTAIILSGEMTKEIAKRNNILPERAATIVDLFACVCQGLLPYGAQILMAGSLANISPLAIMFNVHYCFFLGITGIVFIISSRKAQVVALTND